MARAGGVHAAGQRRRTEGTARRLHLISWRRPRSRRVCSRGDHEEDLARTLARCPSRPSFHRLAARYRTCSSASLHAVPARQATRTSHDARQRGVDHPYAPQDGEEGRGAGAGAGGEEGERHMCHQKRLHPLTASAASRRRWRRGRDVDGDGDEESAHDVRPPTAPHTPPVACAERERHRWGGRSVGSRRCSGWGGAASALGTSSSTSVTSLISLFVSSSFHPDAALRLLRFDYSSRSARASHHLPPALAATRMARARTPSRRLGAGARTQGTVKETKMGMGRGLRHRMRACTR
ncbi:hypothetical protein B0H14DRAFT_1535933 [Mycena olivaceomarginata]|nr:hypothetical protein B0H14DRAFT_1535933 [Mycena olivaceomarginata]